MAAQTTASNRSVSIGGLNFTQTKSRSVDQNIASKRMSNAGKAGTLSTRTDNDTGVATLSTGHGISTGAKVDVYWSGGKRYGVTVGTVSGNTVPIDLGAGDNYPIATTVITLCVRITEPFIVDGDNIVNVAATCVARATVLFADVSDAVLLAVEVSAGEVFNWSTFSSTVNPFAGFAITQLFITQSGAASVEVPVAAAIVNS
jgi:hypothetical protein